jgi:hypothetical protein
MNSPDSKSDAAREKENAQTKLGKPTPAPVDLSARRRISFSQSNAYFADT